VAANLGLGFAAALLTLARTRAKTATRVKTVRMDRMVVLLTVDG
jgi:hypothetical protein